MTGRRQHRQPERMLATVMFVDIVRRPLRAATLKKLIHGGNCWKSSTARFARCCSSTKAARSTHRATACSRRLTGQRALYRDAEARFEDAGGTLGLEVRCGLHTGECEIVADDLAGIAVHIGARVASLADAGKILVSQTLRDLVAGSGLTLNGLVAMYSRACRVNGSCTEPLTFSAKHRRSASGQKRTCAMPQCDVRFTPESDVDHVRLKCPLSANRRHQPSNL